VFHFELLGREVGFVRSTQLREGRNSDKTNVYIRKRAMMYIIYMYMYLIYLNKVQYTLKARTMITRIHPKPAW
jgi:hypothetical protein